MIAVPHNDEYAPFYAGYVGLVPPGSDVFALLRRQPDALRTLLQDVIAPQASTRPAPDEWSIKEVVAHITDAERIFAYRALRIARGDTTPLAGFDQDAYMSATDFNSRPLADLIEEFDLQRRANVLCFSALTDDEVSRRGTASNAPVSVRALLYIMAGHAEHHIISLRTDYKVQD